MKKNYLMTPGPTPVPEEALLAMARPIIHHRTPQFQAVLKEVQDGLKYVFKTARDVFLFTSSGTGAMEAALVNLLSAGDKAIVVVGGKFGQRWQELCKNYGVEAVPINVEWGKAVEPSRIADALAKNKDAKAVFTTLCETSTGTASDVKAIQDAVKKSGAVQVVDAISGLGVLELATDEWGIDVVVSGSQKGLMIPPGLSFVTLSERAWQLVESSKLPKYYFDLKSAKKALDATDTPFTPAISLCIALNEALKLIRSEGIENVIARHKRLAEATRAGVAALGLQLFAQPPCDALTAVKVPSGVDGEKLVKTMRDKYGVTIAGGQAEMKGKLFRIAHMGYMNEFDVVVAISCLEAALREGGYKFAPGAGVGAAQEVFLK